MARKYIARLPLGGVIALCAILLLSPETWGQIVVRKKMLTISGTVGLSNVTMQGLPGAPITDENGVYSAEVEYGWSGKATPVKLGYTFEPREKVYQKVTSNLLEENYEAKLLTFTISGSTNLPGVKMTGFATEVVSDERGRYTATVEYGWSGMVMPEKMGYRFEPSSKSYSQVKQNYGNDNYTPHELTFTISGSAGVAGAVLKITDLKDLVAAEGGNYSIEVPYGWAGSITPTKDGHEFTPPSRDYEIVVEPQANQNYSARVFTYTISGTTGIAGVVMKGLPDDPVTDLNGYYTAVVQHGFSGKVIPELAGYTFEPPSRPYPKVTSNQENQDYKASVISLTISGSAGTGNVTLDGLPGNPTSDATGFYSAKVEWGWNGTVTPQKDGWYFEPATQVFSSITQDKTKQDFKAQRLMFTISGNANMPGVLMQGLPGSIVSGPDGSYSVDVDYKWSGKVTPKKPGFTFEPDVREYTEVLSPQVGEDYTARTVQYTVSGQVTGEDGPLANVLILADGTAGSTSTDADGQYQLQVDHGWKGKITPDLEGYTFSPSNKSFESVAQNIPNQSFTAKVKMLSITYRIAFGEGPGAEPIGGVKVTAEPGGYSAITGNDGKFTVRVPYGWTGELKFEKPEFEFPEGMPFTNVVEDYDATAPKPPVAPPTAPPIDTTPPTTQETAPPVETTRVAPDSLPATTPPPGAESLTQIGAVQQRLNALLGQAYLITQNGGTAPAQMQQEIARLQQQLATLQSQAGVGAQVPAGGQPDLTTVPPGQLLPTQPTTSLLDILARISEETGVKIAVDATVKPKVPVIVGNLAGLPIPLALQRILDSTPESSVYKFQSVGDTYLVYRPITNMFQGDELPQALQDIALTAGVPIIPDPTVAGEVWADISELPLETALEIILAGTPYVFKKTPNYYLVADRNVDSPAFAEISVTRTVWLNYIAPDTAVKLLSPALSKYVKGEGATDPNGVPVFGGSRVGRGGHIVTITAPPALVDRIVEDLKRLDNRPRQVLLDARVVVMEQGDLLDLGVEWGFPTLRAGGFKGDVLIGDTDSELSWSGFQLGYTSDSTFTDSLLMALHMLEENNQADITSYPQLVAQDGRQSEIRVITEQWFMMEAARSAELFYARAELEKIESGTVLTITPYIGDNNDITVELAVEVSDSIARGRGSDLPVVTRRTAKNTVTVQNGGTVALAGLTENRGRDKVKKVPGLGNLPLIGQLFTNTEKDNSTREVAVFVTARLVPESAMSFELGQPGQAGPSIGMAPAPESFEQRLEGRLMRRNQ